MLYKNYDHVDILVNGKPISKYQHEKDLYVEGRPGSTYEIRVKNPSYFKRVKAVISVDGLSILTGKPASASSDEQGYIIDPLDTLVIDGWRTDQNNVAQFKFGKKGKSYSNKLGEGTDNVGVIGVVLFEECERTWQTTVFYEPSPRPRRHYMVPPHTTGYYNPNTWESSDINAAIAMSAMASVGTNSAVRGIPISTDGAIENSVGNIGTEFGQEVVSKSKKVQFESKSYPLVTAAIYYDDRKGLEARGIVIKRAAPAKPNPFPSNSDYCKRV